MTGLDRRDEIIDDVAYGRLTPEAAEAEAARLGLEPFERTPDPAEFDPMAEVNWTLPMAMAWIAQRTPEAVRDAWDKYAGKCWFWRWRQWRVGPDGPINEGWFLEQRSTPTSTGLELLEVLSRLEDEGGQAPLMTAKEARDALWDALGAGMLPATGMPRKAEGAPFRPANGRNSCQCTATIAMRWAWVARASTMQNRGCHPRQSVTFGDRDRRRWLFRPQAPHWGTAICRCSTQLTGSRHGVERSLLMPMTKVFGGQRLACCSAHWHQRKFGSSAFGLA